MRRRKWWFIGLGLFLLAACVFAWKWSGEKPLRSLKNARYESTGILPNGTANLIFLFEPGQKGVRAAISRELGAKPSQIFKRERTQLVVWSARNGLTVSVVEMGAPPHFETMVSVSRRATILDRTRAWLDNLKQPPSLRR